jgi:hypothetical protein
MTSSTDPVHQFLQSLEETRGDTRAQAALTAEFLLMTRSEAEWEPLRDALDAATVLRWFDDDLLGQVLEIPTEEARRRSEVLNTFSFVERFTKGEKKKFAIYMQRQGSAGGISYPVRTRIVFARCLFVLRRALRLTVRLPAASNGSTI